MTVHNCPELSLAEYQAVCRNDLYTFTNRCFVDLLGGATFLPNWHMEVIAAKLQACMDGKTNAGSSISRRDI